MKKNTKKEILLTINILGAAYHLIVFPLPLPRIIIKYTISGMFDVFFSLKIIKISEMQGCQLKISPLKSGLLFYSFETSIFHLEGANPVEVADVLRHLPVHFINNFRVML